MKWVGFLSVIVIVSALFVVVVRHQNRLEFLDVRTAEKQRDQLNDEWGRLQLEKATWARYNLIEQVARDELGMITPGPADMVLVQVETRE